MMIVINRDTFNGYVRLAAGVVSVILLVASAVWSNGGFQFEVDGYLWAGWALAAFVTVMEFVTLEELDRTDRTAMDFGMGLLGLGAYGYGILTNILGLSVARGGRGLNIERDPVGTLFLLVLAVVVEVAPEMLIKWSLGLEVQSILTKLFATSGGGGGAVRGRAQTVVPGNGARGGWQATPTTAVPSGKGVIVARPGGGRAGRDFNPAELARLLAEQDQLQDA